ncbi:patatin-like phospholipase family protein [Elizabethkingia sp. JS20170427COW]|uniref:patatin-like phospholipase family protein n=1 Tax=Elizabethkingia sp. JS20170427COW TaxID=2583851 RepID=UPI003512D824
MRALVISGGGSKEAFARGIAEYLVDYLHIDYDIFIGTSTGSLLIPHLALDKVSKIKNVFTSVHQNSIFSDCPLRILEDKNHNRDIKINYLKVLKRIIKGHKTFGESGNLRKLIAETFTEREFIQLQQSNKKLIVTVSNLSLNTIEYKSIHDFSYSEFCDWIWISCNYIPFMSLVKKIILNMPMVASEAWFL